VVSTDVALDYDRLVDRRRSQRRTRTVTVVVSVVVAVFAVFVVQSNFSANSQPQPMKPVPGMEIGDVPVWYDDAGLHRGDVVEQTPVELRQMDGDAIEDGALALVRTGALYLDPATNDVWFHPWGGDPRIVGHSSSTGPSANPDGDIAAWFDGTELVVYDTAANVKLLPLHGESGDLIYDWRRRPQDSNTCNTGCYEHEQPGNGFLEVSGERVVWTAMEGVSPTYVYDVPSGKISRLPNPVHGDKAGVIDTDGGAAVYAVDGESNSWGWHLVLEMPGQDPQEYPKVNPRSRFSPSGRYVLSDGVQVGGSGDAESAAIIDTKSGNVWPVPGVGWSWVAWSYGDIALLNPSKGWSSGNVHRLLACNAAKQTCTELPVQGPVLMPTS
jgi:hypothetical protein